VQVQVSFNPILGSSGLNSFGAGRFLGTGVPEFRPAPTVGTQADRSSGFTFHQEFRDIHISYSLFLYSNDEQNSQGDDRIRRQNR